MPCAAAGLWRQLVLTSCPCDKTSLLQREEEAAAEAHQSAPFVACLHALMRGRATALVCRMIVDVLFGSWTHSTARTQEARGRFLNKHTPRSRQAYFELLSW